MEKKKSIKSKLVIFPSLSTNSHAVQQHCDTELISRSSHYANMYKHYLSLYESVQL